MRRLTDDVVLRCIFGLWFGLIGLSVLVTLVWGLWTGVIIGQELYSW